MNRSPLNGAPLGSGSTNNLVRVVITQTLELVGSVKGTLLKYAVITQDLVHESSLRATVWVTGVLESVCEQVSSLVYGVETGIPNSLVSTLEMQGSCAGTKESNNTIELASSTWFLISSITFCLASRILTFAIIHLLLY